jgi:hypothetical protein
MDPSDPFIYTQKYFGIRLLIRRDISKFRLLRAAKENAE